SRTVFPLAGITGITWNRQIQHDPDQFSRPLSVDIASFQVIPGAIDRIAYGRYSSPEYLVHPGEFVPSIPTGSGTPEAQSLQSVYFNVVLPAGAMPAAGWPVAIYGTGAQGTKDTWLPLVAASMASHGIATVCINFYGAGFGPRSTLTVRSSAGPV